MKKNHNIENFKDAKWHYSLWHGFLMASDKYQTLLEKVEIVEKDLQVNPRLGVLAYSIKKDGKGINFYCSFNEKTKDNLIFENLGDTKTTNHDYFLLNKYLYFFFSKDFEKCWPRIEDFLKKEKLIIPDSENNDSIGFLYLKKNVENQKSIFLETKDNSHTMGIVPLNSNFYEEGKPIEAFYSGVYSPSTTGQFVCYIDLYASEIKLKKDFKKFIKDKKKIIENRSTFPFIPLEYNRNHFDEIERYLKVYEMKRNNVSNDDIWKAVKENNEGDYNEIIDLVTKYKSKAEKIIINVEKGVFPGEYQLGKKRIINL
jgi:hypothetical protein